MGAKLSRCGVGHSGGTHASGGEYRGFSSSKVIESHTNAYDDQMPGTSGLRKKTRVFMQPNYVANFAQSVFDCLLEDEVRGGTLLVSGDGRFFSSEALREICAVAAGNGVGRIWIGQHGLASTPACSAIIRERENGVCFGGFLLTASHNPGGIDHDFGIKYNTSNGAPGAERLMAEVFEKTKNIRRVRRVHLPPFSLEKIGTAYDVQDEFKVEVIDAVEDWLHVMHRCFDFSAIERLFALPSFSFVYDAMNGVSGPYAKKLFVNELKAPSSCLMRAEPKPDFGGDHPDPNLTYAKALVEKMHVFTPETVDDKTPLFGAAGDGDCDRNMILGRGFFVTPSDSVALIAFYAEKCIPFFYSAATPEAEKSGGGPIKGLARSMPTSQALDQVAAALGKEIYETPTGWKFFANLMDAKKISICGEESFGTGSVHVREKDGLWAVLAWLSILAYRNNCFSSSSSSPLERMQSEKKKEEKKNDPSSDVVTVKQIVHEFWKDFGRNFYCRYDFENKESEAARRLMAELEATAEKYGGSSELLLQSAAAAAVDKELLEELPLEKMDVFEFKDPVDQQVAKHQGVRLFIKGGSRIIWRLSGTGSTGTTIRVYVERYEKEKSQILRDTKEVLQPIVTLALQFCRIREFVGTDEPTVIT